jgi:SAM-dependent methyltransferase
MSNISVTRGYGVLEEFLAKERSKLAEKLIPSTYRNGRILDIGCGKFPFFLLNTSFSKKYGLDKIIRKNYDKHFKDSRIIFINHDIEKNKIMPFDTNYFDVVTILAVVEHIKPLRLARVFKEIYRILKPGGMLLLTTPAVCASPILKCMARLGLLSLIEISEHKYLYSTTKIRYLLQQVGFKKEDLCSGYYFLNTWTTAIK